MTVLSSNMTVLSSKSNTIRPSCGVAVAIAGAMLFSGCSSLPGTVAGSDGSAAPGALALVDENGDIVPLAEYDGPKLDIEVSVDQVIAAISALGAPQPMTLTFQVTGSIGDVPYRTNETVTSSSPEQSVIAISVDHYEYGALLLQQLGATNSEASTSAPAQEALAVATAATVPVSYLVDGDTRWLQIRARQALNTPWDPDNEVIVETAPDSDRWVAEPIDGGDLIAPAGLGCRHDTDAGA